MQSSLRFSWEKEVSLDAIQSSTPTSSRIVLTSFGTLSKRIRLSLTSLTIGVHSSTQRHSKSTEMRSQSLVEAKVATLSFVTSSQVWRTVSNPPRFSANRWATLAWASSFLCTELALTTTSLSRLLSLSLAFTTQALKKQARGVLWQWFDRFSKQETQTRSRHVSIWGFRST
jgi:hypothetical protein